MEVSMNADNFSLEKYCKRIGYQGSVNADIHTLKALMRHQLFSVPFENLDVQAGKIVSLIPEEIVEKILVHNRGGYCYEVNGLFSMVLQKLGISYQFVAARPMFYPVRRPKTHMAIVAELFGELWLCDLGFGSYGIREPIKLSQLDTEIQQDHDAFMLSKINDREYLLKAFVEGEWANQYSFDLAPQEWIDFMPANYLNSTHPDAVFVQKLLIVLHNEFGRSILFGDLLKEVKQGIATKRHIMADEQEAVLANLFNLKI